MFGFIKNFINQPGIGEKEKSILNYLANHNIRYNTKIKNTALIEASKIGHLYVIKYLIRNRTNIEATDQNDNTALIWASCKMHIDIVKYLVEKGANIEAKDKDGNTALIEALKKGYTDIVKYLVEKGANIEAKDKDGYTALILASKEGYIDIVKYLIKNDANIEAKDKQEWTALHFASRNNRIEIVKYLIENGVNIEAIKDDGWSALMLASCNNNMKIVQYLIENGANIEAKNNEQDTALILASKKGYIDIVRCLIENGANIEVKNYEGENALLCASYGGYTDIVIHLIENGANIEAQDNEQRSSLILAAKNNHKKIVKIFLENGALFDVENQEDVEYITKTLYDTKYSTLTQAAQDGNKEAVLLLLDRKATFDIENEKDVQNITRIVYNTEYSSLIDAVEDGNKEAVKFLIENGANIETKDKYGYTALRRASICGHTDIVKYLIENGANIEAKDKYGDTALNIALILGYIDIVKYLIENGANIETKDKYGDIALIKASIYGHTDIVEFLIEKGANKEFLEQKIYHNPVQYRQYNSITDSIYFLYNMQRRLSELSAMFIYKNGNMKLKFQELVTTMAYKYALLLPDGKIRYTIIDPVGMGDSFSGLLGLDKKLYGTIYTEQSDISQQISNISKYIAYINQNYLKGEYEDIWEFNKENDLEEPFHLLLINDFPSGFNKDDITKLKSIITNGKKAGVGVLLIKDEWCKIDDYIKNELESLIDECYVIEGDKVKFTLDNILTEHYKDMQDFINENLKKAEDIKIEYSSAITKDEKGGTKYWSKDSSEQIVANIGMSGKDTQQLIINNQIEAHALLIGRSGSGKSNLLHMIINDLLINYSPEDLKLYLIDMKGGIEFIRYIENTIPQIEVTSVTSDREMAFSILLGIQDELYSREKLFSSKGVQNIAGFNERYPDEKQPRVLLILDEFQELFSKEDDIKRGAIEIFDRLAKKGRSFGINMILSSQTLGGDSIPSTTINQFAVRIVLQCTEDDSARVLSADNTDAKLLTRPGEGIYNNSNGVKSGNQKFQTFWMEDQDAINIVEGVSNHAVNNGYNSEPKIFREDIKPSFENYYEDSVFSRSISKIAIGQPYSLNKAVNVRFDKQDGSHLMIAGNNLNLATMMFVNLMISLALDKTKPRKIYIANSGNSDEDIDYIDEFVELLEEYDIDIVTLNKRNMLQSFESINDDIQRYIDGEKNKTEVYIFMFGMYRIRQLRKEEYVVAKEVELLSNIIKNGAEFGIRTVLYVENVKNIDNIFDKSIVRNEFNNLIALQMSQSDSMDFIGNQSASSIGEENAILYTDDTSRYTKFRPMQMPKTAWVEKKLDELE